ncbi:MAG: hypothetical protein NTY50_13460 [Methylobacter sp.]|nr:hypothetical protein [Methylobacter sp.]
MQEQLPRGLCVALSTEVSISIEHMPKLDNIMIFYHLKLSPPAAKVTAHTQPKTKINGMCGEL